jgi:hypothetical protein
MRKATLISLSLLIPLLDAKVHFGEGNSWIGGFMGITSPTPQYPNNPTPTALDHLANNEHRSDIQTATKHPNGFGIRLYQ